MGWTTANRGLKRPWNYDHQPEKKLVCRRNAVPEVIVGGISYKSDRFYLNAGPTEDGEFTTTTPATSCQCGAQSCDPPPLFDRDKLLREKIDKNELEAVVIGTFTLAMEWTRERYPELTGPKNTIPTLVLHGQKGIASINGKKPDESVTASLLEDDGSNDSWDANCSPSNENHQQPVDCNEFGPRFHLTQVLPTSDGSIQGVSEETKNVRRNRKWKGGVHHPKFLLLFEKSGDLTVVVSTANMVPSATLEGSWIQRFRHRQNRPSKNHLPKNDFGFALQDYLIQLGKACEHGGMELDAFLLRYLDIKLDELFALYHFEKASVHLIPTIPGRFRSADARKYGRHRIQNILQHASNLPTSPTDQLIVQPTSIGSHMSLGRLAHIGKSYLNCSSKELNYNVLERMKILWPSLQYLSSVPRRIDPDTSSRPPIRSSDEKNGEQFECFVFLSAAAFNSFDMDCLHRLAHFEPSQPSQFASKPLTPHFKSVARLCGGNPCPSRERKETFSWFLLTSACLSMGAQGKVEPSNDGDEFISYANFELGVLFTSERPEMSSGRLYCFGPKDCCSNERDPSNLIHLPVPYSLRPKFYLEENETTMNAMPYFHEIKSMDMGGNNFSCTPYKQIENFQQLGKKIRTAAQSEG